MISIPVNGLSSKTEKKVATHNAQLSKLGKQLRDEEAVVRAIPDDSESASLDELRATRDASLAKQLALRQQLLQTEPRAKELLSVVLEEVAAAAADAEAAHEKARAKVIGQLNRAGHTVESDPAFHANAQAAEIKFEHKVSQSMTIRESRAVTEDARRQLDAARKLGGNLEAAVHPARQELKQFVRSSLAVHG